MRKRSERSVREIYDRTETIDEPEMTHVLEGSCCIQGPTELQKDPQRLKSVSNSSQQRNMFCGDMRAETGTCNMCSAPCSSCMHRIAMEANVDCESSDNIFHRKETDICSVVDSKSRESPNLQHADSEASNLLTASSSHNSFSDNAESKETLQATITYDMSEAVEMSVNSIMFEKLGQAPILHTNTTFAGKASHDNTMVLVHQTALHKHESDCHDESNSCISGARDVCVSNIDQIENMGNKETPCNLASYNITGNEFEKVNEIHNSDKTNKLKKCPVAQSVDLGTCISKYDANEECTVMDIPMLLKEEDQCLKIDAGLDLCEAVRKGSTKLQPEAHVPVIVEPHLLDCHMEVHAVAESHACEPEVLVDVKVCDICGDVGKEASLATCSRCLDGAEHIYCMRIKLNKLPEGDWLCEECQRKEESEKKRLAKSGSMSRTLKAEHLGKKIWNSGISVDHKNCPKSDMNTTDPVIRFSSESMKSPKKLDIKHMGHSHKDIISSTLKNVSPTSQVSVIPKKGASPAPESFYKNSNLVRVKPSETALSPGRLSMHKLQASSHSKPLSSNVSKSEREFFILKKLQKQFSSNSLSIMPKPKQLLKTSSQVFSRESTSMNIRKEGTHGTLSRSASLKSVSLVDSSFKSLSKSQMLKSPRAEDSRGFKSMKEGNMIDKKKAVALERPVVKSLSNSMKPTQEVDVKVESNAGNSNNKSEFNIICTGKISEGSREICDAPKSKSGRMTDIENRKPGSAVKGVIRSNSGVAVNTLKNVGVLMSKSSDAPSDDKDVDSLTGGSRQVITVKDGSLHSHRFKELNNATDSRRGDKINASSLKPSAKVNVKKRDRCKDAVEAALEENIQKKTKNFENSEEHKISNYTIIAEVPSKSSSAKIHKKISPPESMSNGQKGLVNTDSASGKREKTKFFEQSVGHKVSNDTKVAEGNLKKRARCKDAVEADGNTQKAKFLEQSEEYKVSNNTTIAEVPSKFSLPKICEKTLPSEAMSDGQKFLGNTDAVSGKREATQNFEQSENKGSNSTTIAEVPSKSPLSSKIHEKTLPLEEMSNGDKGLGNTDSASDKREGSKVEQLMFDLNTTPVPDEPKAEHPFQCISDCASRISSSLGAPSFPQHDFIWRGDFEISRTGRHPEIVSGIQAHMSFSASPKVPLVAGRFPSKIQLVEVPRVRSWPLQFEETSPTEENIALYFFAKDFESYEKSYQTLLDDMLKSDLALIGSIDEVELLIFPSNKLPEASQRWNTLFFLWGVFRVRKPDSLKAHANLQEKYNGFGLTNDALVQESVSFFQKISAVGIPKEKIVRCKSLKVEETNDILKIKNVSGEAVDIDSSQLISSCSQHMNDLPGSLGSSKSPMKTSLNYLELNGQRPCAALIGNGTFLGDSGNVDVRKGFNIQVHEKENANKPFSGLSIVSESREGGSMYLEEISGKIKSETEQDSPAVMETDSMNWKSSKRPLDLCSLPLWCGDSKSTIESKVSQDNTHFVFGEDDQTSKRMKYSSCRHYTSSFGDGDGYSKSAISKIHLFPGICLEKQHQDEDSKPSVGMPSKSKLVETWYRDPINFIDVSSDDDCPSNGTIDLNLALGPSGKLPKETTASVSQVNRNIKGKLPSSVDGMGNISDALSLALPLASRGQQMQKFFKTENLFPDEPEGSTSLPLFWGGT